MAYKGEDKVKTLIERYQRRIFALVLYLVGGEQDQAYDVCADSFAEAIRSSPPLEEDINFFIRLVAIAVANSRMVKSIPAFSCLDILDVPPFEKGSLRIVLIALLELDFDTKAALLLRDQLCLSYKDIASIIGTGEASARHSVIQARLKLRHKIEEVLNKS